MHFMEAAALMQSNFLSKLFNAWVTDGLNVHVTILRDCLVASQARSQDSGSLEAAALSFAGCK